MTIEGAVNLVVCHVNKRMSNSPTNIIEADLFPVVVKELLENGELNLDKGTRDRLALEAVCQHFFMRGRARSFYYSAQ